MPNEPVAMTVACPYCDTRYLLPDHLLGPGGARVRCPSCQRTFVVPMGAHAVGTPAEDSGLPDAIATEVPLAGGAPAVAASAPRPARAPSAAVTIEAPVESRGATETPEAIARAVLGALASKSGAAMDEARAGGRLFAEFGPALFAAYDEYLRRLGSRGGSAPFLAALRESWGVDLPVDPVEPAR